MTIPRTLRPHTKVPAISLAALLGCFLLPADIGLCQLSQTGRWTPYSDWRGEEFLKKYAVHMVLLRSDGNPYHSRILWFRGQNLGIFRGGEWGWTPATDDCQNWPTTSFKSIVVDTTEADFFCTSHATLESGAALLVGGSHAVTGNYGENKSRAYNPGPDSSKSTWSSPYTLAEWRWYPTATTLRDGRVLALGGIQHRRHRIFGGRQGGQAPDTSTGKWVYRFAGIPDGEWDAPVVPELEGTAIRPAVRTEHSFVEIDVAAFENAQIMFGGIDGSGNARNDTWLLKRYNNSFGPDFLYTWKPANPTGTAPIERSEHSAVWAHLNNLPTGTKTDQMIVFGGLDDDDVALNDVHRLHRDGPNYRWTQLEVDSVTSSPTPRLGHGAAFHQTLLTSGDTLRRMIVFGGAPGVGQTPTDTATWELRFDAPTDPNKGTWRKLDAGGLGSGPLPSARVSHAMVADPAVREHPDDSREGTATFLYGGKLPSGAYSDTLWVLWNFEDGTSSWEVIALTDSLYRPGPRAGHTLEFDPAQGAGQGGRLYLFGGKKSDALHADRYVYVLDPWDNSVRGRKWLRWEESPDSVSGHTAVRESGNGVPRVAEVFSPATSTWEAHDNSLLYQGSYPKVFQVPGPDATTSRVISFGPSRQAYRLDIPGSGEAGAWQQTGRRALQFTPLTGVLYRPDRILLAGGEVPDTEIISDSCVTLDASNPDGSLWQPTGSLALKRANHNLVLLPNGKVMAVGGVGNSTNDKDTTGAVKRPEIWDPATGTWSGSTTLAEQATIKNYHSTAILLPDGRVLSAGGEDTKADKYRAEIFCPPYLFDSNGDVAVRPSVTGAPLTISFADTITVCVADTSSISRAALIRPGAPTHSFDHNQRYVPLNFVKAGNPSRILVTMPSGSDMAPLGDYLLFLTGSEDGADVPSIAKWVRVSGSAGLDLCDSKLPETLLPSPELISLTQIYFEWTAPADDTTLAASGRAVEYDFRRSANPIHSDSTWNTSTLISGEPTPSTVGTLEHKTVTGLQSCTTYYFALRAEDDNENLSAIHDTVKTKTLCTGGGGGDPNAALDEVVNTETGETVSAARGETRRAGLSTQSGASGTAAAIAVEAESLGDGAWRFTLRASAALDGADASKMLRQVKDAAGDWQTQSGLGLEGAGARLGLAATGRAGRKVFPGTWELVEIAPALRSPTGDLALVSAEHSSLGDLAQSTWSGDGAASLASGEALTLVYEPSELETAATQNWFALLQLKEGWSPTHDLALGEGTDLPKTFALYQNQPNPFSQMTNIRFDLPKPTSVRLTIYDISGRKVRTLTSGDWPAGHHSLEWDHRSESGVRLGAGAYIYRLTTDEHRSEKKMILLAR